MGLNQGCVEETGKKKKNRRHLRYPEGRTSGFVEKYQSKSKAQVLARITQFTV